MKTLITFLTFIFIIAVVNKSIAQTTMQPAYQFGILNHGADIKSAIKPTQLYGVPDKTKLLSGNFNKTALSDSGRKALLIASNYNFNIYQLPLDNMPCLVPGKSFHSNMNTMEQVFNKSNSALGNEKIPNPFKQEELIPSGK
jgi:hypothetical protein